MKYLFYILISALVFLNVFSNFVYANEQKTDTCIKYNHHLWTPQFKKYFSENNMEKKLKI